MEYRDPISFERAEDLKGGIRKKLIDTNPDYAAYDKTKDTLRTSGPETVSSYVELPAPELTDLPSYKADTKLVGTLRIYGSELKNSVEYLARGFQAFHPDLRITWSNATSSEGAIAGLYTGISDVAPSGDDGKLTDQMPFFNAMGYMPTEISVSTGGYERRGSLWAWVIVVNKDNPLKSISIDELKDVFGAERSGGWDIEHNNVLFTAEYAKSRQSNIRSWDQLGLKGPFAGKEIQTYGYSAPGFQQAIERHWFHWSHKWNPNFMEYVEAKMAVAGPNGEAVKSERPLEILSQDKFGIGIAGQLHVKDYPNLKVLPLSWHKGGPPIAFTPKNVANRTYPMIRDGYFYVNKAPGQPLDPKVREFMRFVLSREGQEIIAKVGYYYPLNAEYLAEQRKKLDDK
jgi:phosphate transport system substrate-binding protein